MSKEQSIQKSTLSTIIVMGCTLLSRILGFVRIAVITAYFGASGKADVINLTFAIPNNLRKLLAEGALSSAFIPVLSESIVKNGSQNIKTRNIVRSILSFQFLIIIPLSIVSIIFAKPLIEHILTQFTNPGQVTLAISLFRFFINYLLFISISAVMIGVLNSTSHFFIPAITPLLFSISVITSIIVLNKSLGIYSMAFGVLAGGLFQVLFQYPLFHRLGFDFKPRLSFKDTYFKTILKHWVPVLATSSIFTINQQVAFLFASGLAEGSASAVTNSLVFWQLPFGIFSASITTVLFPRMSRQAAIDDKEGLRESLSTGIRLLFSLLIPSAVFLGLFGKLIIASALQRGLFTADNTFMTAGVLTGYVFGLFSVGGYNFLLRFFYAARNFKTPFIISTVVCTIDIVLSLILKETYLGVTGLAIANSIAFSIGLLILYILTVRKLVFLYTWKLIKTAGSVAVSILPAFILSWYVKTIAGSVWEEGSTAENWLYLSVMILVWIIPTLILYKITGNEVFSFLKNRKVKK